MIAAVPYPCIDRFYLCSYVQQGDSVYFPADNAKATADSCDCGEFKINGKCGHTARAKWVLAGYDINGDGIDIDGEALEALVDMLIDTSMGVDEAIAKIFGISAIEAPTLCKAATNRLLSCISRCRRCGRWKDVDDMSEDLDWEVCLGCVR